MIRQRNGEQGAVLLMIAVAMVALLGVAAVALDLAGLRLDRSLATTTTDNAAAAGAAQLALADGQTACDTAFAYIDLNMDGVTFSGADCTTMPASCNSGTAAVSTTATGGSWTATVTYPVPDGHPLLDPGAIGATTQSVVLDDGVQCERIGVEIINDRNYYFAAIIGANSGQTDFHTVARGSLPSAADLAINLLILERYDCDAISASGSGAGIGGIVTDAVFNTDSMMLDPGWTASDSDGTGAGCAPDGAIDADGANAFIRADGPPGCPTQSGTHIGAAGLVVGEGCGQIRVLAPGTPGCNQPACTASGGATVNPPPEALSTRVTRAPVDHRYNCKSSYSFGALWAIDGCPDPPAPHIDNLVFAYDGSGTTPAGFTRWNAAPPAGLGHPCNVSGPPGSTITVSGNIHVECPTLQIGRNVHFTGGDVIFEGDVNIQSSGTLAINADTTAAFPFTHASNAAVAFLRNGEIRKAGQASFIAHRTTMYVSDTSDLTLQGGSTGTLLWTAPTVGNLEDLALWSEAPGDHDFAGQALLDLEGVFFTPWATVEYAGQGNQEQVDAQFIARKLRSTGQGLLVVRPSYTRAVLFPRTAIVQLIR